MWNPLDLSEDDERTIAAFMSQVSALPARWTPPDPMPLWWKAQLLRRWEAERMVTAPIDFMQPVEVVAGLACLAFLLYRAVPLFF